MDHATAFASAIDNLVPYHQQNFRLKNPEEEKVF